MNIFTKTSNYIIKNIKKGTIIDYFKVEFDRLGCKCRFNENKRQNKKLIKLLRYANKNCKYYKSFKINVNSSDDLKKYPLLTKKEVVKNYNDIVSCKANKMLKDVAHTGGSTGEPLEFYRGAVFDDIFQKRLWKRKGYKKGDIILAMDGAKVEEEKIKNEEYLYVKSKNQLPYGGYGLSSLYLTDDNIEKYCKCIEKLKPQFIRGYPSFVYRISKYIVDNDLKLDVNLKGIELTSESSYDYQYKIIKKAFKCNNIFLQYGHTETCVFGYTFGDDMRYYCEPLYGFIEVLDENGKHVKVGETGEVVVTTLHNYVMPFIRYKTGDYAEYGGKDSNGIILNKILGRTQDYIINRNNDKVLLTALIFAQHFDALGKMERWQIEQFEIGKVILHIKKNQKYLYKDEKEIKELFNNVGNVDVIFDYDGQFKITKRGKSMMLIQHVKSN